MESLAFSTGIEYFLLLSGSVYPTFITCQENALADKTRQVQARQVFENLSGLEENITFGWQISFHSSLDGRFALCYKLFGLSDKFSARAALVSKKLVLQHHKPGFVNLMMASAMIARANDYQCI
jgi:hypothetical protein